MADVFTRLGSLSIIGFSIFIAFEVGKAYVGSDASLLSDTLDGVREVLLLPLDIAIYRLLILGEVTSRYSFELDTSSRFQRIAGWTIGLWAFNNLPLHALTTTNLSPEIAVLFIAIIVAGNAVVVRMAIFFPAIASDAKGATIASVLEDTSSRFWYILKAFVIVSLPLLIVTIAMLGLASVGVVSEVYNLSTLSSLPQVIFIGTIDFLTSAASVVMASLLFDWIGDRVKSA